MDLETCVRDIDLFACYSFTTAAGGAGSYHDDLDGVIVYQPWGPETVHGFPTPRHYKEIACRNSYSPPGLAGNFKKGLILIVRLQHQERPDKPFFVESHNQHN